MRHSFRAITLAITAFFSATATAQSVHSYAEAVAFPYAPPEAPHRHSSTAAEGFLRGQAVRVQAEGNYCVLEAQADLLRRQSESMYYDNELKKTVSVLARKELLSNYRQHVREQKRSRRDQGRELRYQRDTEMARQYRLNRFQLNLTTGAIYWPAFVAGPRYARNRHDLELLMYQMVRYGDSENEWVRAEATRLADRFRAQLRSDFQSRSDHNNPLVLEEYRATHRFLLGLKYAPLLTDPVTG
ncbi:MAG: hypothetical protein MK171_00535 [Pirellulales bacterium]|nr:hypothetical protein [Pirellulales bacterium]